MKPVITSEYKIVSNGHMQTIDLQKSKLLKTQDASAFFGNRVYQVNLELVSRTTSGIDIIN